MINVTNGKVFRLLVDDEPFDVRYGEFGAHEQLPQGGDPRAALLDGQAAGGPRHPRAQNMPRKPRQLPMWPGRSSAHGWSQVSGCTC